MKNAKLFLAKVASYDVLMKDCLTAPTALQRLSIFRVSLFLEKISSKRFFLFGLKASY